jgi:hypothetical protein
LVEGLHLAVSCPTQYQGEKAGEKAGTPMEKAGESRDTHEFLSENQGTTQLFLNRKPSKYIRTLA